MTPVDWGVITLYLAGVIGFSLKLSKQQLSPDDYYVGGRKLPWWAVGISTMATQSSANSFVGIPAFVALVAGGGMTWLQYELAMPLAMGAVMILMIRRFRELNLVSVYGYLEKRFDGRSRRVMAVIFLLSRGLAAGVGIYASAVVLSTCLGLSIETCMILVGVVTIIYDSMGGMTAVVWTDVVQMGILMLGIFACIAFALVEQGSVAQVIAAFPPERLDGLRLEHGIGDGSRAPLWGFLVGGLFLYMSYYGVDQSQMQRCLSAPTIADSKRSLVLNGFARFPLTLLYLIMGLCVGSIFRTDVSLMEALPGGRVDAMIPVFVLERLPMGLRGLIFAAVMAAAMSTLDSYLNSLSASTMNDLVIPYCQHSGRGLTTTSALRLSRLTTFIWGSIITAFGFFIHGISEPGSTVVESINMVGSLFYGPMLAVFLVGLLSKRATGPAVLTGLFVGVAVNLLLWLGMRGLFWMWWNVTGVVVAAAVAMLMTLWLPAAPKERLVGTLFNPKEALKEERPWARTYVLLIGYFVLLLTVAAFSGPLLRLLS